MTSRATGSTLVRTDTMLPVSEAKQVAVKPGDPWPSAYRGSRYSLVSSRSHGDVVQWSHNGDIQAMVEPPDGLQEALAEVGKPDIGRGSFRITATGEVITKLPADAYEQIDEAPIGRGHIPVYVGILNRPFDFDALSNDPPAPDSGTAIRVWSGLPFNHGETWTVTHDDELRWIWKDFHFPAAFDHPELIAAYKRLRPTGGRIYINEHGHVWGNIDRTTVPRKLRDRVAKVVQEWRRSAPNAEQRLVSRRLQRTESDAAPEGLLPVHLGHLRQFDNGMVPKPIVTDKRYFTATAMNPD